MQDFFANPPLITERQIQRRLTRLAAAIAADFQGEELVVIGLLKGSFVFLADMARGFFRHGLPVLIDFMMVSSYRNSRQSSQRVRLLRDVNLNIRQRQVLLVDDILDTGCTLSFVLRHLKKMQPAQIKTCVLLDKPARRVVPCVADYVGFVIPDKFVIGYGLDHAGRGRELPYLTTI